MNNKLYNRYLVWRFPFLRPKNVWDGEYIDDYDYTWTMLDEMPTGWRKSFGIQMCKEIKQALIKYDFMDKFMILQIKEKFGGLRFYTNGVPSEVHDIIHKYENKSYYICCHCGKPATQISTDWICPWCDTCAKEIHDHMVPISEYYKG